MILIGTDGDGLPPSFSFEERGGEFIPWIKTVTFEGIRPKIAASIAVLKSRGVKKIVMTGFCWGAWVLFKAAAEFPEIIAAAVMHPTVQLEQYAYEGDIGALAAKVKIPVLVLPAGGVVITALKANNPKSAWNVDFK